MLEHETVESLGLHAGELRRIYPRPCTRCVQDEPGVESFFKVISFTADELVVEACDEKETPC